MRMPSRQSNKRSATRLTKDEWLAQALDTLSKRGKSRLTIDSLVAKLGVTKGSFYWHFENRADFIQQLMEYWGKRYTDDVVEKKLAAMAVLGRESR